GIFALFLKEKLLNKILLTLVSLSAGAMMGGAFLHLIPEAIEKMPGISSYVWIIVGFTVFFFTEKLLHWRHCHKGGCKVHTFGYMNIVGDGIHNFIDGLIIAGAFLVDIKLGLVTTFAIALHEIPQEMGDFGVLVYAGFKRLKALILNYISASTVVLGAVVGYFIGGDIATYILPFAAGGFIYIAASDLIPEIKKEMKISKFIPSLIVFILGVGLMLAVKLLME
ncbi:MAG: ZIP family metal transporter, partial [Patescibacteria group bacterium]|nr:ZIP family metal transporter [Patescibacteria group bacterium]